jgi:hypothetical protein
MYFELTTTSDNRWHFEDKKCLFTADTDQEALQYLEGYASCMQDLLDEEPNSEYSLTLREVIEGDEPGNPEYRVIKTDTYQF